MTSKCAKPQVSKKHPFYDGPHIMGVVNVTPDSFSDGGEFFSVDRAIEHGLQLLDEGTDILDIGGESTRPGAKVVDIEEEIRRIVPVIEGLAGSAKWISIDSRNAKTMEAALAVGANIINDVSALTHDPQSINIAAEAQVPVVLMHMIENPQVMQKKASYNNVVKDIIQYLQKRIDICDTHRIDAGLVVCDPGIGFGKTVEHNLSILRNISDFHALGVPLLLGTSRKSFIGKLSNDEPADDRLSGSIASALWGLQNGVQIFRVHDVKETRQAFKIHQAILSAESSS